MTLLPLVLVGCVRFGFAGPCSDITCGGHGTCEVVAGQAICVCDPGYHAIAGPSCALELPEALPAPLPDALLERCLTTTPEDVAYACAPMVAEGDDPALHLWSTDTSHTCAWAAFNAATGVLEGVPDDDDVGSCTLAIVGDRGLSGERRDQLDIRVTNVRPTLTIQSPGVVDQESGSTVVLSDQAVHSSDEGHGVYSLFLPTPQPPCADHGTLSIDSASGAVTFAPTSGYNGRCALGVSFDDQNEVDNLAVAEASVEVQPLASFETDSSSMDESNPYNLVTIRLTGPALREVTLPYSISGTAGPADHTLASGSATIPLGGRMVDLQLEVNDDLDQEPEETVVIELLAPSGAGLGSRTRHVVTIQDNDLPPLTEVTSIHAGNWSVCAKQQDGTIRCWGFNDHGQLGTGSTVSTNTPVVATALGTAADGLSLGYQHSCAIFGGAARCWGRNHRGQLGDGGTTSSTNPVHVSGLLSGVTAVAAGEYHSCAVVDGGARCWGGNAEGQLGDGSTTQRMTPVEVQGLSSGVTAVAVGDRHSCALLADGSVRCWGLNTRRQLGDDTTENRSSPITPVGLGSGAGVVQLALGYDHTCALLSSGGIKCWGSGTQGQLGTGTGARGVPTDVVDLGEPAIKVAIHGQTWGGGASCAILSGGAVKCWGTNTEGQVGDGTLTNRDRPVGVSGLSAGVVDIARTIFTGCALLASGNVRCWGTNTFHTLGNNKYPLFIPFPVHIRDLGPGSTSAIALGGQMSLVQKTDGALYTIGANSYGQLGLGDFAHRSTLTRVTALLGPIETISAAWDHSCAQVDGGVWCWGGNDQGAVGIGDRVHHATPVAVTGLSRGVRSIANGGFHSCAALDAGGAQCWGWNYLAAVGDGTTQNMAVTLPTPVVGLDPGQVVDRMFAGYSHTCAVYPSGAIKCWGWNSRGQLGIGTVATEPSAVDVTGLPGIVGGAAGYEHTCLLTAAGGVKCMGGNSRGELGDGTRQQRTTPVDAVGLTGIVDVAAGMHTSCALSASGAVWCWGDNALGTVGDRTFVDRDVPTPVHGLSSGVVAISVQNNACALMADGSVRCWGANTDGCFGDGRMDHHLAPVTITAAP